ncbi:hypothetical protein ADL27_48310 [Streptomyces sp. NRRL F-6602]|nr:hypothetical protein ADL27_48310 [Streptomyces sp. NRRL F-6602]
MSRYLEEAAAVLRRAAKNNERYSDHDRDIEIARGFSVLAAIDKGLLPAELTETALDALRKAGGR